MEKTLPPAAVLKLWRATRDRRLRSSVLLFVALLGLSCASAKPRHSELWEVCQDTLRQGVFNASTLACYPEVAGPLEDLLCATTFRTHRELNLLGFGYGSSVLGQTLREADFNVRPVEPVDPGAAQRWKQQHCAGEPARSEQEAAELRDRALSLLPAALVGPWQSCRDELYSADPFARLTCAVRGSFDLTGEDETVQLLAAHSPADPMDYGIKLKEDVEVQGADCNGERWRAGTRFWFGRSRVLRCQRQGRSAVSFRLVTGNGQCEARLPELTEPPWQAHCTTP